MNISMNNAVPTAVNYTKFMSPIKNQFYCGSCYSFATAAVLEYQSRKAGLNHIYSEQNIVDCDSANYGCDGGWPTTAMYYVHENGISNGSTYTYDGQVGTCRRDSYPSIHKINKVCEINLENNEENLMKVVATIGPVAGVIVASDGLFNYGSGVFYDPTCDPDAFDHAISIVGYGTHRKHGDYWIMRNSWGDGWGMQGYALIARNRNNSACGLAKYAMYPC